MFYLKAFKRLSVSLSLVALAGIPQLAQAEEIYSLPSQSELSFDPLLQIQQQVQAHWVQVLASRRPVPRQRIEELLKSVDDALKLGYEQDASVFKTAYAQLLEAQVLMMPSRAVEMRAVLIDGDVIGTDPVALGKLLDKLKAAGFNTLMPEVFRRGFAMFPNRIVEMDPLYQKKNLDGLKMFNDLAQARGFQVYPWLWTFRVLSPSASIQNPVSERLPALISPQVNKVQAPNTGEGLEDESASFVSPAAPEWRQLMALLMGDLARNYPVQGFLLDYIRYGNQATVDQLSQTQFNMDYFRRVGNFPPKAIDPASDLQAEWHLWREEQVHRMVQQLRLTLSETRPGLSLGTAVFRNEVNARNTKMQNWRHWANQHWVDFFALMMYANNRSQLDLWLDWESDNGKRQDILYPILGLQALRRSEDLFDQLALLQQRHIPGVSMFAVRRLDERSLNWLQQGPFRKPAEAPHLNLGSAVRRQLVSIADWLDSLQTDSSLAAQPAFAALRSALRSQSSAAGVQSLLNQLDNSNLPEALRQEIRRELEYAQTLAGIQSRQAELAQKPLAPTRPPSAVLPEARALPAQMIPYLSQAPLIDGLIEEPAWQGASVIPALWWSTGSSRPQVNTRIQLGYDDQALYLAYRNAEPRLDRLVSSRGLDGTEQLAQAGTDDTLEVFLSPGNQPKNYYYFVVNAANARFAKASFDSSWQAGWESQVARSTQDWSAELRIPFSSLNMSAPVLGGSWRGNLCRRRPQEIAPYHCWSFTFGGVHRIDRFGTLQFAPKPQPSASPSLKP